MLAASHQHAMDINATDVVESGKWSDIYSLDDLKRLGSFRSLKNELSSLIGVRVNARTWDDLFRFISSSRKILCPSVTSTVKHRDAEDDFFLSISHRYIFALIDLDGKSRQKILGVDSRHYSNKDLAKQWYRALSKKLHPDAVDHPLARTAFGKLHDMYQEML